MQMPLGYDGKLYILAFDHRGSFQKKMFGIEGDPSPEETATISDAKHLIYEGMVKAVEKSDVHADTLGVLVDEQFGAPKNIQKDAKAAGLKLAMPVEKSGQDMFDFEYGDDFGQHILDFDPDFSKVLVRYNSDHDAEENRVQLGKLKTLADWLHENGRLFLFELLVPAEPAQLESVGGDSDRYDAELRPELMRKAIEDIQDFGIEVDIWKIEGVDERSDAEILAKQTRKGEGRENVVCVLLGRGASDAKVDQWLQAAAPVDGFIGFAIGRSIWWDALKGFLDGSISREEAQDKIADNYLRFIQVYESAEQGAGVA
jgi:myo-inositol catabolism protein IolC